MAYRAAWLIGSYADLPAGSIDVNGGGAVAMVAGSRYLYNPSSFDLLALVQATLIVGGAVGAVARLQRDGKVQLSAAGVFSVTWGTNTLLRDLLGFTGNISGASSYAAPLQSPLLWMPGKPETPMGHRLGVVGHEVHVVYQAVAPYSGKAESVSHGSRTYARYLFPMVDTDRVVTEDNDGGTYARWFAEVAVKSARWKLYREVLEDPASTASVMSTLVDPLGPYVVSADQGKGPRWTFDASKGFERTDARADVDIRCHVVEEYT